MTLGLKRFILLLALLSCSPSQAASPVMVMHQVSPGETWRSLAVSHQLSERQLRWRYNQARFMRPLMAGEWIWLPQLATERSTKHELTLAQSVSNTKSVPASETTAVLEPTMPTQSAVPATSAANFQVANLPRLGRPNPKQAPKTAQLKLTLASAAQAAANQKLDKFVEQQGSHFADSTLSFGSRQISDLLWLSPEHWSWDYQLPLFDKELMFNSSMALPLANQLQAEVGVDYRDQRLTYQAGFNLAQQLAGFNVHLEPVLDYQTGWDHQRGGLLAYFSEPDWTLGAGQYQPLSGWQQQGGLTERAAAGQVVFGEGRLGWLPGLSVSSQFYQWQGERLNLHGSGDKYKAPMSRQWSLNYAPWQIFRLQSSLLSNSKDKFETRFRLGIELPLGVAPERWWKNSQRQADYRDYQPLQHHQVLVLEHK